MILAEKSASPPASQERGGGSRHQAGDRLPSPPLRRIVAAQDHGNAGGGPGVRGYPTSETSISRKAQGCYPGGCKFPGRRPWAFVRFNDPLPWDNPSPSVPLPEGERDAHVSAEPNTGSLFPAILKGLGGRSVPRCCGAEQLASLPTRGGRCYTGPTAFASARLPDPTEWKDQPRETP